MDLEFERASALLINREAVRVEFSQQSDRGRGGLSATFAQRWGWRGFVGLGNLWDIDHGSPLWFASLGPWLVPWSLGLPSGGSLSCSEARDRRRGPRRFHPTPCGGCGLICCHSPALSASCRASRF